MDFLSDISNSVARANILLSSTNAPYNNILFLTPNSSIRSNAVGLAMFGSSDMIHINTSDYQKLIPEGHLNHNRERGHSFVRFDTEMEPGALCGKIVISTDLDSDEPTWCELATVADIPLPTKVYTNVDAGVNPPVTVDINVLITNPTPISPIPGYNPYEPYRNIGRKSPHLQCGE